MPRMPMLAGAIPQRLVTDTFAGYNHNLKIADGEFFDTKNLTTAQFPMLANRGRRGVISGIGEAIDDGITVEGQSGSSWDIPAGDGDDGDIVMTDGDGRSWHLIAEEGEEGELGVTDGAGHEWRSGRPGESVGHRFNGLRAIIKKNAAMYWVETETVNGNDIGVLYADGAKIDNFDLQTQKETQLVSMGSYILIFPDAKYFNTMDYRDRGDMGATWTRTGNVSYRMCQQDGTIYERVTKLSFEPNEPQNEDIWIDTTENTVKIWSTYSSSWAIVETVYTKVIFSSMGTLPTLFKEHDGVRISGLHFDDLNGSKILYAVGGKESQNSGELSPSESYGSSEQGTDTTTETETTEEPVEELIEDNDSDSESGTQWEYSGLLPAEAFGSAEAEDGENDYIILVGILEENRDEENVTVTISRTVPQMDFVCEAQNRLWGCHYGNIIGQGNVNELYCCALGDFKNWEQYLGVSTDSWRASCGSDGVWTGCINYLGSPTFFKENRIHPISVSSVGAHQVGDLPARGVQDGSSKSLAIVNETLYYKTRSGVVAWQGGMPVDVGAALGDVRYYEAVAGVFGQRYYISMRDAVNAWNFFCYDVRNGLWMREDELHADGFTAWNDELYAKVGDTIVTINGTEGTPETRVDWYAETGVLYYELADHKYVSHFNVRLKMEKGAKLRLFIEYDSNGIWEYSGEVRVNNINSFMVPVRPRRCDHLRLKLVGEGDVRIFSIARILERGSDM